MPARQLRFVIRAAAVDQLDVGRADAYAGQRAVNVRRGKQALGIEDDVVAGDLNAGKIARSHQIVELDMKAAEQALQGYLQHVDLRCLELDSTVGQGRECSRKLDGKRDHLVHGSVQLKLRARGLDGDIFQRRLR